MFTKFRILKTDETKTVNFSIGDAICNVSDCHQGHILKYIKEAN